MTNHPDLLGARASEIAITNNRLDGAGLGQPNNDDNAAAKTDVDNRMKACFMLGVPTMRSTRI